MNTNNVLTKFLLPENERFDLKPGMHYFGGVLNSAFQTLGSWWGIHREIHTQTCLCAQTQGKPESRPSAWDTQFCSRTYPCWHILIPAAEMKWCLCLPRWELYDQNQSSSGCSMPLWLQLSCRWSGLKHPQTGWGLAMGLWCPQGVLWFLALPFSTESRGDRISVPSMSWRI